MPQGISANGFWARAVRAFKDNQMKLRTKEEERKKRQNSYKALIAPLPSVGGSGC